ncbi:MAG: hemin uptake protein HemP [Tepidimonas sp.]|uniref:hemin uptake protein HemP n=1 Tax=Tepidimonas sp. TaxID=2002775 RepID=UPI00259EAD20|nr:hemin uptake protein HemP [Tepidimonas sp.]MDM7456423.1 hemin uptake protein HemP [Tepidimonas sp.]
MRVPGSEALLQKPLVRVARDLFQGRREIFIQHDGQEHRLRLTRQNKLTLTK